MLYPVRFVSAKETTCRERRTNIERLPRPYRILALEGALAADTERSVSDWPLPMPPACWLP